VACALFGGANEREFAFKKTWGGFDGALVNFADGIDDAVDGVFAETCDAGDDTHAWLERE